MLDYDALIDKAYKKSRKFADENGYGFYEPSMNNSGCENYEGKEYIVFRNCSGLLSVWLVENGGEINLVDHEDYPDDLLAEISA